MLSGCLIDDPPAYSEPRQTPPRLNVHDAQPLLNKIIVAKSDDVLSFKIGVTSEDAGEDVTAQLLLDYNGGERADLLRYQTLPASTIDDRQVRQFELDWRVTRVAPGCHRFTLRAAHSRNLPDANHLPLDTADLDEVYWWANIDADAASSDTLIGCPGAFTGSL